MASINELKRYQENSLYHVYNRGVNKQEVFFRERDYEIFLNLSRLLIHEMRNDGCEIDIYSYALLPNHFHFVLWQLNRKDMVRFMRSLTTRYVTYINRSKMRTGNLFVRPYKARLLQTPQEVAKAMRYVLNNPAEAGLPVEWKYVGSELWA